MTLFGLTVVAGIMGALCLPFFWLVGSEEHIENCRCIIALAAAGVASPFYFLYCFLFDIDKLKEML